MSDKEKLLIGIIIMLLGAILSYRIGFIDNELLILKERVNKITNQCDNGDNHVN